MARMAETGVLQNRLVDRVGDDGGSGTILCHGCRFADGSDDDLGIPRITFAGDGSFCPLQGHDRKKRVIVRQRFWCVQALDLDAQVKSGCDPGKPVGVFHQDETAHAGGKCHQADLGTDTGWVSRRQDDRLQPVTM